MKIKIKKEDIEELDISLQEYIRYAFKYIGYIKDRKSKAEEIRTKIHDFKVLQNEEMLEDIEKEYDELVELICEEFKEE